MVSNMEEMCGEEFAAAFIEVQFTDTTHPHAQEHINGRKLSGTVVVTCVCQSRTGLIRLFRASSRYSPDDPVL